MIGELGTVKQTRCALPHTLSSSFWSGRMLCSFSSNRHSWELYHWKDLKFRAAIWKIVLIVISPRYSWTKQGWHYLNLICHPLVTGYGKSHCRRWSWTKWAWADLVEVNRKIKKVSYNNMIMWKISQRWKNVVCLGQEALQLTAGRVWWPQWQ